MIILIILLLLFLIPFGSGVVTGIKNYKPHGEDLEEVDEQKETELAMIEYNIIRRKEASFILENELEKENIEPLKKARLLNQLNTLDKQTFKDYKRIQSIKDEDG